MGAGVVMSDDLRTIFNDLVSQAQRGGLLRQLRDKVIEAAGTGKRECGNCYFWMKSTSCPRERNERGRRRGPSCVSPACDKFEIEQWVVDLKRERILDAVAFAATNNLPIPSSLQTVSKESAL